MQAQQVVIMVLATCTLIAVCYAQPISPTKYCGSHLADALKLACEQNGYNAPSWADNSGHPKAKYAKHQTGVATECCYMGCTWRTLISYCAGPRAKKSKKSSGDDLLTGIVTFNGQSSTTTEAVMGPALSAAAPEMNLENIRRSAPLFGTVSPEYLRLPRTLDELPPIFQGMQGY